MIAPKKITKADLELQRNDRVAKKLNEYNSPDGGATPSYVEEFLKAPMGVQQQPTDNALTGAIQPGGKLYDYTESGYDNNIFSDDLSNLDNLRAENQGVLDSLANSTANFVGKTAVNVVGGLGGAIYGVGSAIANGELSKLWDNDVTTALDNSSDAIGEYFKVYKNSDYQDKFILNKMFTNPIMFADEMMDTLSFTAGAVLTEMLSGGIASAAVGSKAVNFFSQLSKGARAEEALQALNTASKVNKAIKGTMDAGKLSRQLATGAFWESSVEARHASHDLKDKMIKDFMASNGISTPDQIPQDVMDDIDARAEKTGLATLALNMPLVGFSNLSQFPSIFGLGMNTTKKGLARVGYDAATETAFNTASKLTARQQSLNKLWAGLKNPFMEGFVEEGGQGVISKGNQLYFDRSNDLEAIDNADKFIKSYSKAFMDTYTTTEGLNEVLMGAIIGGVGSPGKGMLGLAGKDSALGRMGFDEQVDDNGNITYKRKPLWSGGVVEGIDEMNTEIAEADNIVRSINENPSVMKAIKANYDFLVKSKSINDDIHNAFHSNNKYEFENSKDDSIYNYVSSRLNAGLKDDVYNKLESLEAMSPEEFYKAFKGDEEVLNATPELMESFQAWTTNKVKEYTDNIVSATNTVNNAYLGKNEALKDQLTYLASTAKNLDVRKELMMEYLTSIVGDNYSSGLLNGNTIPISETLSSLEKNILNDKTSGNYMSPTYLKREKALKKFIKDNPSRANLPTSLFEAIYALEENDNVSYELNKKDIDGIIDDLDRIDKRKSAFINMYNKTISAKGQRDFEELQKSLYDARERAAQREEDKIAKDIDKANKQATKNIAKETVATKKGKPEPAVDNNIGNLDDFDLESLQAELDIDEEEFGTNVKPVKEAPVYEIEEDNSVIDPNDPFNFGVDEGEDLDGTEVSNTIIDEELGALGEVQPETTAEVEAFVEDDIIEDVNDNELPIDIDLETTEVNSDKPDVDLKGYYQGTQIANKNLLFSNRGTDGKWTINESHPSLVNSAYSVKKGDTVTLELPTFEQVTEYTKGDIELEVYNQSNKYPSSTIIAIKSANDEFLGFLMTASTVKVKAHQDVKDDLYNKSMHIRETVINNPNNTYSMKVTSKSTGHTMYMKDKDGNAVYKPLSETVMVDGEFARDVEFVYSIDNLLRDSNGEVFNKVLNNPQTKNGHMYVVQKLPNGELMKHNVRVSKVDETDVNTIIKLINLRRANPNRIQSDPNMQLYLDEKKSIKDVLDVDNGGAWMNAISSLLHVNRNNFKFVKTPLPNDPTKFATNLYIKLGKNIFNMSLASTMRDTSSLRKFLSDYGYKGVRLSNHSEEGVYSHPTLDEDGNYTTKEYESYDDYVGEVVMSDLQGEQISELTKEMYFQADPMVSLDLNPVLVNTPTIVETTTINPNPPKVSPDNTYGGESFLDDIDLDSFDIPNSSYEDLKDRDMDSEIDDMIKNCK